MADHFNPNVCADDVREQTARIIAERLLRAARGSVLSPLTWKRVARNAGVKVVEFKSRSGTRGYCEPSLFDEDGALAGVIYVNTLYPREDQARVWIHELAHLSLAAWIQDSLSDKYQHYDDGSESMPHEIARRVELIILANPVREKAILGQTYV
jgi:hypothetical protein